MTALLVAAPAAVAAASLVGALVTARDPSLASRLARIAADGLTGQAPVLALAELFRHGRAVSIPDAGHYPWVEQPHAFAEALAGFYPPGERAA